MCIKLYYNEPNKGKKWRKDKLTNCDCEFPEIDHTGPPYCRKCLKPIKYWIDLE